MSKFSSYTILVFLMLSPIYVFSQTNTSNADQGIVLMKEGMSQGEVEKFWDKIGFKVLAGPLAHLNTYLISDGIGSGIINGGINGVIHGSNGASQSNGLMGVIHGSNGASQSNSGGEVISAEYNYDVYTDFEQFGKKNSGYKPNNPCHSEYYKSDKVSRDGSKVSTAVFDTGIIEHTLYDYYKPFAESWGYNYYDYATTDEPQDDNGHGTGMSSIIAFNFQSDEAISDNLRITSFKTHDKSGQATMWTKMEALDQSISDKVQIINMSFSYKASFEYRSFDSNPFSMLISIAEKNNVLCVASAGNDGINLDHPKYLSSYPAAFQHENILTVGAMNCRSNKSYFSNYGNESVDVFALGEGVPGLNLNGSIVPYDGTSPAAALVSSVASQLATYSYNVHYSAIKCGIMNGVISNNILNPLCQSGGSVNPTSALNAFTNGGCGNQGNLGRIVPTSNQALSFNVKDTQFNLNIDVEEDQKMTIMIVNTMGQVVSSREAYVANGSNEISLSLPQTNAMAIYFAQILVDGKMKTIKFVTSEK